MRIYRILKSLVLLAVLTGCAAHYSEEAVHDPYGFFSGVWHGLIFVFALLANIISWFFSLIGISFLGSIEIIGRPNTGLWYYVGFAFGLMVAVGGCSN